MLPRPLRWLIWLMAFCVPAQASAGVWLRVHGPAHVHVGGAAPAPSLADAQRHHGHAHGHAGARIAPHEHPVSQAGVLYLSDAGDSERAGPAQPADKGSALDSPVLLAGALAPRCGLSCVPASAAVLHAFASVAAESLYRPPR